MNITQEYDQAAIYEREYGGYTDDFDIFCGKVTKGEALDIACGTGRLTSKLAEIGLRVTGIDRSDSMLSLAKEKAKKKDLNITYLNLDMRDFNLNKKFDLITMAGNSFQALLTEQEQRQFFESVADHMNEKCLFIIDTRNTTTHEMRTTDCFEHWHDFTDEKNETIKVYGIQSFDPKTNIVKYTTKRIGENFQTVSEIELKFTNSSDLFEILKQSGFNVLELYGSVKKEPFDQLNSESIVLICEKAL